MRYALILAGIGLTVAPGDMLAAKPSPTDALKLAPVQRGIDYDIPTAEQAAEATVDVETVGGVTGWAVRMSSGQILRRFLDTNGDNKVDQWCYFKDGIEVYRDIDGDFNNKADQYRWLGTAGTRWGLDEDENGRIEAWKTISAEEVTAEIVSALRDRDATRFKSLLLSESELKTLGLSAKQAADLSAKIAAASSEFADLAEKQTLVSAKSEWLHFGASRPGVVPAGTDGASKDIIVYDNVTAVVETDGKHGQLVVGTLVKVGDGWRIFDLPKNLAGDPTAPVVGYFFQNALPSSSEPQIPATASNISPEMQKLVGEIDKIDKQLAAAGSGSEQAKLNAERADLIEEIIKSATSAENRAIWIKQYAETVSAAVQAGAFPAGQQRLSAMLTAVERLPEAGELAPYVKFRFMTAEYNASIQEEDADYEKINDRWTANLEEFVKEYGDSPDAAEAMLQLAIVYEFSGKETDAVEWFSRITRDFASSDLAPKAAGAKRRLESVGKTIPLKAKTLDGKSFDLASAKNRVVLIHYWATWCEPCKQDLDTIKSLLAKYSKEGFYAVGINLDNEPKEASDYLKTKPLIWPQLYEEGGLDSRLATEMGILTLPTMILIGKDGKVLNRNAHAGELDAELKKLLR